MMSPINLRPFRLGRVAIVLTGMLLIQHGGGGMLAAQAEEPSALSQVLGTPDPAGWTITNTAGQAVEPAPAMLDGRPVLPAGEAGLKLVGVMPAAHDTEIVVRFAFDPPPRTSASVAATLSCAGEPGIPITVSATGGSDEMRFNAAGAQGTHALRGVCQRSLNWPDRLRRLVEHEMSAYPGLTQRWLSLRYVLGNEACELYVNDLLVATRPWPTPAPPAGNAGTLSLSLSPHAQLVSVQSRPLARIGPLFEPVRIDSRLNASTIAGRRIRGGSLPERGRAALVGGIPFVLPEPDRRGNDHIDVGTSWLQNCYVEENAEPQSGLLGGRWAGPLIENPTRIQFQLPKGRYRALHLIAAADGAPDGTPVVTVQFFWPGSGRPESFSARVPLLTATSAEATPLPVQLDNGKSADLYLVTVPIDPGALTVFDLVDTCDLEITKEVQRYRCYPDPTQYSTHAAGLPSAVHVYAMTLERPAVSVEFQPDALGHVWVAPNRPGYTITLRNLTDRPRRIQLELTTRSYDGTEATRQRASVRVPPDGKATHQAALKLDRYGYHDVVLTVRDGGTDWVERRSLAYLHADTRRRGDWQPGRGAIFGFWDWRGGHITPPWADQLRLMARAGAETTMASFAQAPPEIVKLAEELKMRSFLVTEAAHWTTNELSRYIDKPAEGGAWLIAELNKTTAPPNAVHSPELLNFFAEPHLGQITIGVPPDYYGETYELSQQEEEALRRYEKAFVIGARAARATWPNVKCMLPWGDPMFPVYFLRKCPEVRELIGGTAVDISTFERMAENQIHQISIHRLYVMREEYRKAGVKDPVFAMIEGPCVATRPGALPLRQHADNVVRLMLLLYAHGVDRQLSTPASFECASYWGEQHYGGGIVNQRPLVTPKPAYAAYAALTRHINRKNLEKWLPTGSLSVYALQFKHYETGEMTHVFWTVRGRRPVTLGVPKGAGVTVFDQMDNATTLAARDGAVKFTIGSSPCFVEGLTADPTITLGEPDHSDAAPAPATAAPAPVRQAWSLSGSPEMERPLPRVSTRLGNFGDGTWRVSNEEDATYAGNGPLMIARFPGGMTAGAADAPAQQGGKALAVHLGPQARERRIMPFYTTLVPARPAMIPGKASHVGAWVRAASDWGRVVWCLRDAEGERWISVGTKNEWNCDDIHSWSFFCFDGWRYLRFEMPANSPYDQYRENGTTWWGHFGEGDGLVDLPLSLEKVIVERRTHAMYVNDPQPARPDDVLLADLLVEYWQPEDRTDEAVRLSKLRMPVPPGMPDLGNPIAELAAAGTGAPTTVTRVTLPAQEADGTRCYVHFDAVNDAKGYDVWVSPYPDGRGALKVGSGWTQPGQLITGLRQDTDFYIFVAYTDKEGKPSKPSAPLKIRLQDLFGMK